MARDLWGTVIRAPEPVSATRRTHCATPRHGVTGDQACSETVVTGIGSALIRPNTVALICAAPHVAGGVRHGPCARVGCLASAGARLGWTPALVGRAPAAEPSPLPPGMGGGGGTRRPGGHRGRPRPGRTPAGGP